MHLVADQAQGARGCVRLRQVDISMVGNGVDVRAVDELAVEIVDVVGFVTTVDVQVMGCEVLDVGRDVVQPATPDRIGADGGGGLGPVGEDVMVGVGHRRCD